MSLKVSVSGVRGIWGDSLDMDVITQYARAFAGYILEKGGKTVLMGRDGRPTGDVMARVSASVLNMMGLDVVDAGIVPTPTVLFGVRECGFDAGIMLSASHNPLEWNAFKFVKSGGVFTDDDDLVIIKKYISNPPSMPSWDKVGSYKVDDFVMQKHLDAVVEAVDIEEIKNSGLKVLLDPVNCSGSIITKKMFQMLGVNAEYIFDEPHGHFGHPAEPTPQNLTHLKDIILDKGVDVAFVQDPDADRLVVADENGVVLSEELTPVLALKALLDRGESGDIVLNMSSSGAGVILNGNKGIRSKVGEANVVKKIAETKAFYGLEGNGGVIYPKVNTGRDSLVGIALILELLAKQKRPLSEVVLDIPNVVMKKTKYDFSGDLENLFSQMKEIFSTAKFNTEDGLRVDLNDGSWIHLRSSNTEPIVRLIAESDTEEKVLELINKVDRLFK